MNHITLFTRLYVRDGIFLAHIWKDLHDRIISLNNLQMPKVIKESERYQGYPGKWAVLGVSREVSGTRGIQGGERY